LCSINEQRYRRVRVRGGNRVTTIAAHQRGQFNCCPPIAGNNYTYSPSFARWEQLFYFNFGHCPSYSEIIDVVSRKTDKHGIPVTKPVSHVKFGRSPEMPRTQVMKTPWNNNTPDMSGCSNWWYHYNGAMSYPYGKDDILAACGARVPTNVIADLSLEAFNYFATIFPEEISASEFIQGLIEFKALLPELQGSISHTISGGYLNKSFGWDNLLSDLNKLSTLITTITSRLEELKRTYGIPTRLGFNRNVLDYWSPVLTPRSATHTNVPIGTFSPGFTTAQSVYIVPHLSSCTFRAGCWLTQTLSGMNGVLGWIRGLAGTFGLDNPLKAAWNVIPLSFVVDWFFGVDKYLTAHTKVMPAVGWGVGNVSHSIKYNFVCDLTLRSHYPAGNEIFNVGTGTLEMQAYTRSPGLPVYTASLVPHDLGPEQFILLSAMLHQLG